MLRDYRDSIIAAQRLVKFKSRGNRTERGPQV